MTKIVEAFFYGLYMDADLVNSLGFHPQGTVKAVLESYALDLHGLAKVVPQEGSVVWGNVLSLPEDELQAMYAFESTKVYAPEMMTVKDVHGNAKQVGCYNVPPSPDAAFNGAYQEKLLQLLHREDFPAEYINIIETMAGN